MYGIINGYNVHEYNESTDITRYIHNNLESVGTKKEHYLALGSGFDCETTKYGDFAFPYVWQLSLGKHVYICRNNEFLHTFVYQLSEYIKKRYKKSKLIIWVANLSYEYSFYKNILAPLITNIFAKTKRHVLSMECCNNIVFRECLGVFGTSLSDIAKSYTVTQKLVGDLDYNVIRHNQTDITNDLPYMVNDVAILSELTDVAFNMFLRQGKKIPLTQTGIVRNDVKSKLSFFEKKNMENKNMQYMKNKDMYLTLRKYLYSGGLTHSFCDSVGKMYNNVMCADLTSAYPWSFATCNFPDGAIIKPNNYRDIFKYKHWFVHVVIRELKNKTGHSIISVHKVVSYTDVVEDNGRVYSARYLELWMNEIDYNNMMNIYDVKSSDISVLDAYCFQKSSPCPDFIKNTMLDYYKLKQDLKNQGLNNTLEYRIAKAKCNCIYGMVCTKAYDTNLSWDIENLELSEIINDWDNASKTIFNCFIGYWCTSYVRQRLVECISMYPNDIIQYDTDSIYFIKSQKIIDTIKSINDRITNINNNVITDDYAVCRDLGLWDNDGYYINFIPLGAKRYIGEHSEYDTQKILDKKFYSKGKTPNNIDILKARYKITFAGAKDTDILTESKRLNKTIWEYIRNFSIESEYSTKLTAKYFDDNRECNVTDCNGVSMHVSQYGGTILEYATFNACISEEYYTLTTRYNEFLEKSDIEC